MSQAQTIERYLTEHLPVYLELLRKMVAINSFTANSVGVNALGELTADAFAPLGFKAETVQSLNPLYGKHLVLTRQGHTFAGQTPPVVGFVSHLDTVFPPDEEQRHDFRWREVGNRIYGPGTVDIKGGTIVIYMMLSALQALAPAVFNAVTWVVLLDASEESGGRDFGRLCVERLGRDALACLIFEGGGWYNGKFKLVVARKGMAVYRLTAEGKAAHAGSAHERGANAVVQMAEAIRRIGGMTDYERALTFNVGTVAGGTVINRVPHFASASVEMRAFTPEVYQEGLERMLALNELSTVQAANGDFACRLQVEVTSRVDPWSRNPRTDALYRVWEETAVSLGYTTHPEERGGLSDGNYFWHELPTLDGLGPSGGNAHCSQRSPDGSKDQEFVRVSSFVPKALLNTMAVLRLVTGEAD